MIDNKTHFSLKFPIKLVSILSLLNTQSQLKKWLRKGGVRNRTRRLLESLCTLSHTLDGPTLVLFNCAPSVRARNLLWAGPPEVCIYSLAHDLCTWNILPGVPTSRPRGSLWHAARPNIGREGGGGCRRTASSPHTTLSWCRTKKSKAEPGLPGCDQGTLSSRKIKHFI